VSLQANIILCALKCCYSGDTASPVVRIDQNYVTALTFHVSWASSAGGF